MANRFAVPIFSTSKVDSGELQKNKSYSRNGPNTPRGKPSTPSTPLSSRRHLEDAFKTPTNLNNSRQRWKSASSISESKLGDKYHLCSPSLSPKSGKKLMNKYNSENSLNDSNNLDSSLLKTPSSPHSETSNFLVGVRVRPFNAKEEKDKSVRNVIKMTANEISLTCGSGTSHSFQYDHCFWSFDQSDNFASQENVFSTMVEPLLDQLILGYNACLLAYGQTGSGKSYSMMGVDGGSGGMHAEAGVIPRFCSALFERIAESQDEVRVEVSFYEIYNEKIHDLLASHKDGTRPALRVREHPKLGPYIVDLAVHGVTSYNDVKGWLTVGNSHRITSATAVNEKSSRSHSIFSVLVTQKQDGVTCRSQANLVDLAGSERVAQTAVTGNQLKEGVSINKSLLSLGKVITFLAERGRRRQGTPCFGPYRESVLTWLLRESLGGNSKTAMLATISPANVHVDETLATLRYACQARSIVNRVHRNEDPNERLIRELRMQLESVASMRAELEELKKMSEMSISNSEGGQAQKKQQEIDQLKQQLKDAESKVDIDSKPWQEKLQTAAERQSEELQYLKGCGVAVESTVDTSQSCLVTLFPDPMLSEKLLYLLPPGKKTVGRGEDADIVLHNPLVAKKHCVIENINEVLWLRPCEGAETFVNGIAVTRDAQIQHGDRLAIGGVHFFRVRAGGVASDITDADYDHAQRELKREQEARLRNELRAELDASHALELNEMAALLQAQNTALQSERRVKSELEAERDDLQARFEKDAAVLISPYRSTFRQQFEEIFSRAKPQMQLSLLDTHLLTREATQICRDLNLGMEFYQEHLSSGTSLEAVVKIWDTNLKLTAHCQPEQFIELHHVIKEDSKEKIMESIKCMNLHWERGEQPKSSRRMSVRRQSTSTVTSQTDNVNTSLAAAMEEIKKLAARVLEVTKNEKSQPLPPQFDRALPFLQSFVTSFAETLAPTSPVKSVRFTPST